jgi:DNA-binding MarR family transcriptional regulator
MNTRDLEYFVALCDEKNFSQVAKQFGVTQPTITLALKRLESQFAIQLIDRDQSHGSLTITPAGQQLYQRAKVVGKQLKPRSKKNCARCAILKFALGCRRSLAVFIFPNSHRAWWLAA